MGCHNLHIHPELLTCKAGTARTSRGTDAMVLLARESVQDHGDYLHMRGLPALGMGGEQIRVVVRTCSLNITSRLYSGFDIETNKSTLFQKTNNTVAVIPPLQFCSFTH